MEKYELRFKYKCIAILSIFECVDVKGKYKAYCLGVYVSFNRMHIYLFIYFLFKCYFTIIYNSRCVKDESVMLKHHSHI